ncbi:MAG: hypothetical protein JO327_11480 [Nitrososphaeraceae archaeon]|nr:hypothetical protein [Nitrososphaeraceae archaeon]
MKRSKQEEEIKTIAKLNQERTTTYHHIGQISWSSIDVNVVKSMLIT